MLIENGYTIRATIHNKNFTYINDSNIEWIKYDVFSKKNDFDKLLDNIDVVIHLAAAVHSLDKHLNNLEFYRQVNTLGSRILAEKAASKGIKRFIYISTISPSICNF